MRLRTLLSFGMLFVLLPVSVRAAFIIELTSGRQVTVERYVDTGQTVKISTPLGEFSFRKSDISHISEASPGQLVSLPVDHMRSLAVEAPRVSADLNPGPAAHPDAQDKQKTTANK